MQEYRISVIVPCFNYGRYLGQALDSLIAQTYPYWECIVVDDGSTDNTKVIANQYKEKDQRIQYLYQENAGLGAARNAGLKQATGELICFLDADDFLAPQKFAIHITSFLQHEEIDIAYSDVRYFISEKPNRLFPDVFLTDKKWMPEISGNGKTVFRVLLDTNIMSVNAAILKKKLLISTGKMNEGLKAMEDWDFWIRCALAGAFFYFEPDERAFAFVRVHSESMSRNIKRQKQAESVVRKMLAYRLLDYKEKLPDDLLHYAIRRNAFRMAELNIRYLAFFKGWGQILRLLFSGRQTIFFGSKAIKSSIKRFIYKPER